MFRSVPSVLLGLAISLTLAACGGDEDKASGAVCPENNTLTYDTFGQEFIKNYCLGCHNVAKQGDKRKAPVGVDFDTMDDILRLAEDIDAEAAAGPDRVNAAMPPGMKKPTDEERQKLGAWLACETKKK